MTNSFFKKVNKTKIKIEINRKNIREFTKNIFREKKKRIKKEEY